MILNVRSVRNAAARSITLGLMSEATETDLFPWILGGILLVVTGIATTFALGAEPPSSVVPQARVAAAPLAAPSTGVSVTVSANASPTAKSVPSSVAPATPPLPEGQVWQCVIDGRRTFSDAPCGAGASIRQLNVINRMTPTPVPPSFYYPSPQAVIRFPAEAPDVSETSDPGYETDLVYVHTYTPRRSHLPRHLPSHHGHGAAH